MSAGNTPVGLTLVCLGFGYTARFIAQTVTALGGHVFGTTRAPEKMAVMERAGVTPIRWVGDALSPTALASKAHYLISLPPSLSMCPALQVIKNLPKGGVASLHYLSSTGVYGDHQGGWVDEETPVASKTKRGQARVDAEYDWHAVAKWHGIPLLTYRLAGIYGPGRNALATLQRQQGGAAQGHGQRIIKHGQVFNRIHVVDIARAVCAGVAACTDRTVKSAIYNVADDCPCPPQDVITYAAVLMRVPPPPCVDWRDAGLSPMGRSFYAENKRVANHKMKAALIPRLQYPTYQEGLQDLYQSLA